MVESGPLRPQTGTITHGPLPVLNTGAHGSWLNDDRDEGWAHAAGTPLDGKFNFSELRRVIELYNSRAGTVRTGQYRVVAGTEDGFAPGP